MQTWSGKSTKRFFSDAVVDSVWLKARSVEGHNPAEYRKDACNAWIRRGDYGQETHYGWEVDHVRPVAEGGGDDLSNLQPLHWKNNRHKADNWPNWACAIRG